MKLVLCIRRRQEESYTDGSLEMTNEWTSRGVELLTIVAVCPQELMPAESMLKLKHYVSLVEHRSDDGSRPKWNVLPDELDEICGQ